MQKNHLNNTLKASRDMIYAYFVDRNIDNLIKYLDTKHFTFFFITENYFYNSKEEFLEHAVHALEHLRHYELVDDNYSVEGKSQDSCLVVAKIILKDTRNQRVRLYNYIFYFKQQGDNVICTHNHAMLLYEDLAKVSNSFSSDIGIHVNVNYNVVVYPRSHKVKINDEIISFTKFENEIFLVLIDNMNQPVATEAIYKKVYENSPMTIKSNTLAVHISNIRRKLSSYKDLIKIVYVTDEGYCLQMPPNANNNPFINQKAPRTLGSFLLMTNSASKKKLKPILN